MSQYEYDWKTAFELKKRYFEVSRMSREQGVSLK
jgi:hypothetical protein